MLIDVHKQLSATFNKKFNYPINSAKFASQLEWIRRANNIRNIGETHRNS